MHQTSPRKGVTLIEISLVVGIIIILVSTTGIGISFYKDWSKGLAAGEDLKAVYQAQKLLLADNPTIQVTAIQSNDPTTPSTYIIPYLPNNMTAIPSVTDLDGGNRTITITVSPPVLSGDYDPSPPGDNSVWDAGK